MGLSHSPQIVTDSLVLHLDAGSKRSYSGTGATCTDLSTVGNNGTLINSPTYNTGNLGFFTFNGSSNYIRLPTNFFNPNSGTSFAVSIWFKSNGGAGTIFGQQQLSDTSPTFSGGYVPAIYIDSSNKLRTSCFFGSASPTISTNIVNNNNWHNVTVVFNNSNQLTYIDGVLDSSITLNQTSYSSQYNYFLGAGFSAAWSGAVSSFFNGSVSSFMFYNKTLSENEVKQNFNALRGRYGI